MQYRVTPDESQRAGYPHSFFILNLIIVHLFASYSMLEIGYGKQVVFIPFISLLVMTLLWSIAKKKLVSDNWFVAAHWLLMTKRIRLLVIFYIVGLVMGGFTYFMVGMSPLKGDDISTIALRMGAVPVFLGLLVTFVLSGGSIFDAQRGMVGHKIVEAFPPPTSMEVLSDAEGASSEGANTTPQDH
jgi:hypothetical protein